jgi:hypothetical protein
MPRTLNRLKPLAVEKAKTLGRHADGGGLYLVVEPGPRKSWAFSSIALAARPQNSA